MTVPSAPRRFALAIVAILALCSLLFVAGAQAAHMGGLGTTTLCIKKGNPERGKIRFVSANKKCLKGEKRVLVVTTQSAQGVKGIEESSSAVGGVGPTGPQGAPGNPGQPGVQGAA